jgi:hypothetical protein
MVEAVRVYAFARSLAVDPKRVLAACQQAGIRAINQLSHITPAQQDTLRRLLAGDDGMHPEDGAGKPAPLPRGPRGGHESASVSQPGTGKP